MSFPALISTTAGFGEVDPHGMPLTVFEYSGVLYVVAVDLVQSPDKLHAFRSTDAGNTWTEQDSAHAPAVMSSFVGGDNSYVNSCTDGTVIYSISKQGVTLGGPDSLTIFKFDMSSNTWGTAITGGPNTYNSGSNLGAAIIRRSDGSFVIFTGLPDDATSGAKRCGVVTCSASGTWGSLTTFGASGSSMNYFIQAAALGDSDRVHMILAVQGAGTTDIQHASISSANVVSSLQTGLGSYSSTFGNVVMGNIATYVDGSGTHLVVSFPVASASQNQMAFITALSAATPSWSSLGTITFSASSMLGMWASYSKVYVGPCLMLFIQGPSGIDDLEWIRGSVTGWSGTLTAVAGTGSSVAGITATKLSSSIGVVYADNSGLHYIPVASPCSGTVNLMFDSNAGASASTVNLMM